MVEKQHQANRSGPQDRESPSKESKPSRLSNIHRLRAFLDHNVKNDIRLEFFLMILTVSAGINDATTFPDYGVFASNQTGNTALLAVGALSLSAGGQQPNLRLIGTSLGLFVAGGVLFGQLGHRMGCTKRGWLLLSISLQTMLIFIAAALRRWYASDNALIDSSLSVVALLAFQSAGQIAVARTVGIAEIATAMVTSAYVDFLVDPKILLRHNRPRNRRVGFLFCFLAGCFIGAVAYRYRGAAFSLLISAIVKTLACFLLLFCPRALDPAIDGPTSV